MFSAHDGTSVDATVPSGWWVTSVTTQSGVPSARSATGCVRHIGPIAVAAIVGSSPWTIAVSSGAQIEARRSFLAALTTVARRIAGAPKRLGSSMAAQDGSSVAQVARVGSEAQGVVTWTPSGSRGPATAARMTSLGSTFTPPCAAGRAKNPV